MSIATNIQDTLARIARVAKDCGRDPEDIQLVAVSKRFPVSAIEEAIEAGQFLFGENYIQEAAGKIDALKDRCRFHFIGHLQSNKVKMAAQLFDVIETIDRLKLARALNNNLLELGRNMEVLLQVNIGEDEHKAGMAAEETETLLRAIHELPQLQVIGLMTMPPFTDDPEDARPHFRHLRLLAENLRQKGLFGDRAKIELSMGMSSDYHIAIEEGATIVRVGTAIFGERT